MQFTRQKGLYSDSDVWKKNYDMEGERLRIRANHRITMTNDWNKK